MSDESHDISARNYLESLPQKKLDQYYDDMLEGTHSFVLSRRYRTYLFSLSKIDYILELSRFFKKINHHFDDMNANSWS